MLQPVPSDIFRWPETPHFRFSVNTSQPYRAADPHMTQRFDKELTMRSDWVYQSEWLAAPARWLLFHGFCCRPRILHRQTTCMAAVATLSECMHTFVFGAKFCAMLSSWTSEAVSRLESLVHQLLLTLMSIPSCCTRRWTHRRTDPNSELHQLETPHMF